LQERLVAGGGRDTKEGLYRGALASRVKLHKFRQILMHCAVVPGGERENRNQATLIKIRQKDTETFFGQSAALAEEHLGWNL